MARTKAVLGNKGGIKSLTNLTVELVALRR